MRKLAVFWVTILLALASHTMVYAQGGGGGVGGGATISGGGCVLTASLEQFSQTPPASCTGTLTVYVNNGQVSGKENTCWFVPTGTYDCNTGTLDVYQNPDGGDDIRTASVVQSACNPEAAKYNSCQINKWTGQLECGFWKETLAASVGFPGIVLDIEPYPVTLVRWPTYFRFSGAGTATATAGIPFVGRGTADHPLPGDEKDIVLSVQLRPYMNYMQLHIPRAGYYQGDGRRCAEAENFMLPLQNNPSIPKTVLCWNVPSHPAAGAGPLAGSVPGLQELASDFPLFVGWARVPYMAQWSMAYDRWEVVDRNCVLGPKYDSDGNPVYECKVNGVTWNNGHWEDVWDWGHHTKGGVIDPELVEGLPSYLKADINGDGRADAFWDYNVKIRRMDEAFDVNDPAWKHSWEWGGQVYMAVREGQTQSVYFPNASP